MSLPDPAAHGRAALRSLLGGFPPRRFQLIERRPHEAPPPEVHAEWLLLRSDTGEEVRGLLTGPLGEWRELPGLLYCHAHGNRYGIGAAELLEGRLALLSEPYGVALARAGIVALAIDMPCFGKRALETESALAKRHFWRGTTLFGAMLADLEAAFGLLRDWRGVDPDRVGAMGLSMGATHAFWLAALEPRVKAIAHLCCYADLTELVRLDAHDLHGIYMSVPGLLGRFSTGAIAGLAAPRPQLACVGFRDALTPETAVRIAADETKAAYAAAGAPDAFRMHVEPDSGHVETTDVRAAVMEFLSRNL